MESLQIKAIKTTFSGLNNDEKISLIRDLMKEAKIHSIIYNDRPVNIEGHILNPPVDQHKHNFKIWLQPFLSSFLIVVTEEYIDKCFEIYEILHRYSAGDAHGSRDDIGDWFLTAQQGDDSIRKQREKVFTVDIFARAKTGLVQIFRTYGDIGCNIALEDLFVLAYNNIDNAYIVLMIFGYLRSSDFFVYEHLFYTLFPKVNSLDETVLANKDKLTEIFQFNFY